MGKKTNPYALKRSYLKEIQKEQFKKDLEASFEVKNDNSTAEDNEAKMQAIVKTMLFLMEHPECIQIDFEALQEEKNKILAEMLEAERESNGKNNTLE